MAEPIKDFTITLDFQTDKLEKRIKKINKLTNKLEKEFTKLRNTEITVEGKRE